MLRGTPKYGLIPKTLAGAELALNKSLAYNVGELVVEISGGQSRESSGVV